MIAVVRKELADYFASIRFFILFFLVLLGSAAGLYAAYQGVRSALLQTGAVTSGGFVFLTLFSSSSEVIPPLTFFVALFIPIIGIALGFDAINSERSGGTLSRLLAQPVYRDSVINGKFLAGIFTLAIIVTTTILLISGYGLRMIGVAPTAEEIIRLFIYIVLTIVYGAFWMGLAMLFSVVFRRIAGSLLASIAVWLFFYFFWMMIGPAIANGIAPYIEGNTAAIIQNIQMQETLLRFSPSYLFEEAYQVLLTPMWAGLGVITQSQVDYMVPNALSLGESLLQIWPHLVSLASLSVVCFAINYILFMRQEIRAT